MGIFSHGIRYTELIELLSDRRRSHRPRISGYGWIDIKHQPHRLFFLSFRFIVLKALVSERLNRRIERMLVLGSRLGLELSWSALLLPGRWRDGIGFGSDFGTIGIELSTDVGVSTTVESFG